MLNLKFVSFSLIAIFSMVMLFTSCEKEGIVDINSTEVSVNEDNDALFSTLLDNAKSYQLEDGQLQLQVDESTLSDELKQQLTEDGNFTIEGGQRLELPNNCSLETDSPISSNVSAKMDCLVIISSEPMDVFLDDQYIGSATTVIICFCSCP